RLPPLCTTAPPAPPPPTLSLPDALPISRPRHQVRPRPRRRLQELLQQALERHPLRPHEHRGRPACGNPPCGSGGSRDGRRAMDRSEEHTSELQSRENLVCRLLLETKNPQ